MKKTFATISLIVLLGLIFVSGQVSADTTVDQSQKQEGSAECETETVTGAYGQTITRCKVSLDQEQSQKIVYVEKDQAEQEALVHKPVDTALDAKSVTTAVGAIVSGAGAFIVKLKKKIA